LLATSPTVSCADGANPVPGIGFVRTYRYLEATPELMTDIAVAAEALVTEGDA
jgi:hypothetical protein